MLTRRPLLATLAALPGIAFAEERVPLEGVWTGALDIGSQRLRLRFTFGADGAGTLQSLDQGGSPIPARITSSSPTRIVIEVPAVAGRFEGAIKDSGRIEGRWTQGPSGLALVLLRGEAGLAAPAANVRPLDATRLRAIRTEAGSPALVGGVDKRGASPRIWVDGERAARTGIAATAQDCWHVGSITKSMTATLVARLVEARLVSWDDTVGATLGAHTPALQEAYRGVTFRHLLSHRSGLPGNLSTPELLQFARVNPDPRTERQAYAQKALALAPKGPAGATFEYANNGYVVAGAMIEARLGAPWETLIRTHVFQPLGMTSAGFGAPGAAGKLDQPLGHSAILGSGARSAHRLGEAVTDNPAVLGPAGTVHASAADMLRYLNAHRDRTAFLTPASWTTLHTPPFGGDYAMGWMRRENGLFHNGSNTLWYAEAMFDAQGGVSAFAAANDGDIAKSQVAVGRTLRAAIAAA